MLLISLRKLGNFSAEFVGCLSVGLSPGLLESGIRDDALRIETYDYSRIILPQIYIEQVDLIVL